MDISDVALLRYITHPQVTVDFKIPVTKWSLNDAGRARVQRLLAQPWIAGIGRVVSSAENKALETARTLATRLGIELEVRPDIGENDRSATGPLPQAEFEQLADRFFAQPQERVRGWESAVDAQARVTRGLADLLDPTHPVNIGVVGHGAVGTLWYCHLAGLPIDRRYDQPSQGHYFTVDLATNRPVHSWRPIDELRSD